MREPPATMLCTLVDYWWSNAQWRSPHAPEAVNARAERQAASEASAKKVAKRKSRSYEQKLRERLQKKRAQ